MVERNNTVAPDDLNTVAPDNLKTLIKKILFSPQNWGKMTSFFIDIVQFYNNYSVSITAESPN